MLNLNEEIDLLTEYLQWKATQETRKADTSPEEFMRDRVKEIAMNRIDSTLDYLNDIETNDVPVSVVVALLSGEELVDDEEQTERGPDSGTTGLTTLESEPYPEGGVEGIDYYS